MKIKMLINGYEQCCWYVSLADAMKRIEDLKEEKLITKNDSVELVIEETIKVQ